jgi:hypothetical protein
MNSLLLQRIAGMGALRIMLQTLALSVTGLMFFADISLPPQGWGLLFGTVVPAAAPMVVMVLLLDALMCLVLKSDADAGTKRQLGFNMMLHLMVTVLLLLVWVPVFLRATYF